MANNWAIVVGINEYEFLPNASLKFAVADALAMQKFLCEEAGFDAEKVLLCGDGRNGTRKATKPNLRDILLNKLQPAYNADNLWFFFSGHGLAGGDQQDYLMTIDGNPSDLQETAISTHFVADRLRACKAKNIVLALDMCRSENRDAERKSVELQREKQQGIITMHSCDRGQSSYEISDLKQGAFTHALLEGLRKKVLVRDLALYLESRVPELHRSVGKSQRVQVPRVIPDPGWKYEMPILTTLVREVDIAALKEQAINAELDGNFQTALGLWETVNLAASNVDDRQRALKKIQELQARLNPPVVTPPPQVSAPRAIPKTPVAEPLKQPIRPKQQPIVPPINRPTFTRRKMLYVGLGSMGTAGAIALGLSNTHSNPPSPKVNSNPPGSKVSLETFSFPTVKLNPKGEIIKRETLQAQQFISAFDIKMVQIKGGTFKMGSPKTETNRQDDEGPQRDVKVSDFFMGKNPITQAQWKAVAALPKEKIDLKSDPSKFKGVGGASQNENRLPVETVSWEESVEFCDRLKAHTGLDYRLPSEAQWEYACRAGTETPFYFGETLSTEVANYDGRSTYGGGKKGQYLEKTTAIETYPANAWGLYDMHGNVWEWCADFYHKNYDGAPTNGSVWDASNNSESKFRLIRGGSWYRNPGDCRSANRDNDVPASQSDNVGFRVVCLSPRGLS
jgi:formylglycine-generating enzyme required for sulfatase activity/uncharacterized caspase-like protein